MYLMIFLGSVQRFQISGKCLSTRGVIPSCKCDTKLPTNGPPVVSVGDKPMYLAILCDLFGMVSSRDPLERLLVTSNWGIKRSLWHDRSRWKKTSWLGSWDDSAWEWDPVMSVTNILFAHTHNFNVWFVFILPEFPPKLPKCIDNDLGWSKCIVAKFISIPHEDEHWKIVVWKMSFLFHGCIIRWTMLIFRGVSFTIYKGIQTLLIVLKVAFMQKSRCPCCSRGGMRFYKMLIFTSPQIDIFRQNPFFASI